MTEGRLVSLNGLTQPLSKLIEVVAAGVGTLYKPFGTVRQAKADAKSRKIRAETEADVAAIEERAKARFEYREALRQKNLEAITSLAANELPGTVSSESVDIDWTIQYIDQAQDVCDEQLQTLWARILAGEVASPGSYSKRTLGVLKTLDKWEAESFTEICSFTLEDEEGWRLIIDTRFCRELMRKTFENRAVTRHLVSIGLIAPDGIMYPSSLTGRRFSYFGNAYEAVGPPKPEPTGAMPAIEVPITFYPLTSVGQQLSAIAGAAQIPNFVDCLSESMERDDGVRFEKVDS